MAKVPKLRQPAASNHYRGAGGFRYGSGRPANGQRAKISERIDIGADQVSRLNLAKLLRDKLGTPENIEEVAKLIMEGCRNAESNLQSRFIETFLFRVIGPIDARLGVKDIEALISAERDEQMYADLDAEEAKDAPEEDDDDNVTDISHLVTDTTAGVGD